MFIFSRFPTRNLRYPLTLNYIICVNVPAEIAKTRTARTLPLSIETVRPITKFINARPEDWDNNSPLFASCEGEEMNTEVLSRRFAQYSKKLGATVTPYSLRHCFALYYLRNGGNALSLQKMAYSVKAFLLYNYGLRKLPASTAVLLMNSVPVLGLIFSALFLHESVTQRHLLMQSKKNFFYFLN